MEWAVCGIVCQHFAHFLFRKAHHCVKFRRKGIVCPDIETTGQVIHRYGTDSGDEAALDARVGSGFHLIEESAQITFLVCLVCVTV